MLGMIRLNARVNIRTRRKRGTKNNNSDCGSNEVRHHKGSHIFQIHTHKHTHNQHDSHVSTLPTKAQLSSLNECYIQNGCQN